MIPTLITITQNDKGFAWNFTCTDNQNNVVPLTSASLTFNCQLQSDPTVNFSNAMNVVSAPLGTCQYVVQTNDFIVPGTYMALIKATFSGGEVLSFSGITIQVNPIIPI
jgi:hypothetical protein